MWDLLLCTDPGHTYKEHVGAAVANHDVHPQSHAFFEKVKCRCKPLFFCVSPLNDNDIV